jgi:hypothetical protein
MSTNLGTILVGLGYDLSALEKGSPEAFRLINEQTLNMSAQMKRNAREGAEAFRSIDEMIGIHINRPMTRLLVETFPEFSKALSGMLGGVAFGAVAFAGFELFRRISAGIEKAMKAQDALREATAKVDQVFAEEMVAYEKKDKAVTAATAAVDKLAEAERRQQQASAEASGMFTGVLAGLGRFFEVGGEGTGRKVIEERFGEFMKNYNLAALADSVKGTATATKLLASEIDTATASARRFADESANRAWWKPGFDIGDTSKALSEYAADLNRLQQVQSYTLQGSRNEQAQADARQREADATKTLADLYRSIGDSMKKLEPQTDPLKKLESEIDQMRYKAQADFAELGRDTNNALELTAARAALREYETNLDRVLAKAKADAAVAEAMKNLPKTIAATGAAPMFGPSAVLPTLGAGGTTGAQFAQFLSDTNAQLKLAAQAYEDVVTPQQKFDLTQRELSTLLEKGVIDITAYTAALQKAREQMQGAADAMEKMIEKGGVAGGMKAFWEQMQGSDETSGRFTFNLLSRGMQGFEDETAKALMGAKMNWQSFFVSLNEMVVRFMLDRLVSSLLGGSFFKSLGFGGGGASGGGGSLGDFASGSGPNIAGFASGTDYAPGGMAWVGENGPELLNLPSGSSVTPSSMVRSHAPVFHIDARGGEIGVEDKIVRALSQWTPHVVMRAVVESSEMQKRSLK